MGRRGEPAKILAAPGANLVVHINGVSPRWFWTFGSTFIQEELNKVEVGHLPQVHAPCARRFA
jgi:hypothetical protein